MSNRRAGSTRASLVTDAHLAEVSLPESVSTGSLEANRLGPHGARLVGIDGGIGGNPERGSRVVVYASVRDIDATLAKAEKLGGKTVMPRQDIGPVVMALYTDPEGNVMGLVEGG